MFKDYNKLYKVFEDNGRLEKENAELKRIIEKQSREINALKRTVKSFLKETKLWREEKFTGRT